VELDQARIAIHERTWSDNLDLALHVLARHAGPLAVCALLGIVPLALVNHALAASVLVDEFQEDAFSSGSYWLLMLVMIEAPLATALVTLYLGQALFVERPRPLQIAREFWTCLPQVLLLGVLVRLFLIPGLITWIVPFGLWPYMGEVVLLERNPLRNQSGRMSTIKRVQLLHRGASSEFLAQGLGALCVAALLVVAIYLTETFLLENLFGMEIEFGVQLVCAQLALWLVVVFFTVVRFLNYLDQRIRYEGWEVELFLRAQREHLTRHMA
jgi:hypothetical protein